VSDLKIERAAVLRQLGDYETVQDDIQPLTYCRGRVEAPVVGGSYEAVANSTRQPTCSRPSLPALLLVLIHPSAWKGRSLNLRRRGF